MKSKVSHVNYLIIYLIIYLFIFEHLYGILVLWGPMAINDIIAQCVIVAGSVRLHSV